MSPARTNTQTGSEPSAHVAPRRAAQVSLAEPLSVIFKKNITLKVKARRRIGLLKVLMLHIFPLFLAGLLCER